ncbi:MAG: tRNA 2-selenouridine(34) synthase MnmH [Pseudomonadales bacterium]
MPGTTFAVSDLPVIDRTDFAELFVSGAPLLDLRSPSEFARGSFPHATNLSLLTNDERHRVGLCYKNKGQAAAMALGNELVSGEVRRERMRDWSRFFEDHCDAALYCWRGGLRSETVQAWLADAGVIAPRVTGGYKALRQFLLETTEHAPQAFRFLVLGGRTGSGKTKLLTQFAEHADLEALAHHRGSAFGGHREPQPTPIDFENALAIALLKKRAAGVREILVEDESRTIGRLAIPASLHQAMNDAPLVVLEAELATRVENILGEYVHEPLEHMSTEALEATLCGALGRIQRRLGGKRYAQIRALVEKAFASDDDALHREWIKRLLETYYDPQYDHQLDTKAERIVFRGDDEDVAEFLAERRMTVLDSHR